MDDTESLSTDSLLEELGGCGLFQIILILIFNLVTIPTNFEFNVDSFGIYNPGWRCLDNVTDNGTSTTPSTVVGATHLNLMSSADNTSKPDLSKYGKHTCASYDSCQRVEFNPDANTYITEWGLLCNSAWIASTMLSIRMAGNMVSTFIVGYIGDRYGRKRPLIFAVIMQFLVFNLISTFSVSWQMYAVVSFFIGSMGSFIVLADILGFEYVPPDWRVKVISIPTRSIVSILFAVTAMMKHDWRYLRMVVVGLGAVALIPLFWVPRSIRWLSVKGKEKEYQKVVRRIARINKKEIPKRFSSQEDVPYSLLYNSVDDTEVVGVKDEGKEEEEDVNQITAEDAGSHQSKRITEEREPSIVDDKEPICRKDEESQAIIQDGPKVVTKSYTLLSVFQRRKFTLTTILVGFVAFSFDTLYFALSLGVVALPGNLYINMMLSSTSEIPAYIIPFFVANYFKRKPSTFTMFLLVCFCLVGIVVITRTTSTGHDAYDIGVVAFVMAAKLFGNIGYIIFITSVGEMYPTVVRATVRSYTTFCSSVGSIIAPFLIPTDPGTFYITYLVMAVLFALVSVAVLCLPETKGKPMLDDWVDDEDKK